jgi:ABC-2 type transport system permease protein
MSPFGAILVAKVRITRHFVASVRRESKLKVGLVATSVVALWVGAFALAKFSLEALDRFGTSLLGGADLSLVELLIPRVLSIFALLLFVLLVFSNTLLTHATLYRSRDVLPLLASPLSLRTLFLARFVEIVTFSSWSTAYLGSPLVLAYGLVRHAAWPFYPVAVLFFVPFVVVPAALGAIIAMLAVRTLPRMPRSALVAVAAVALVAVLAFFHSQLADPRFRETADFSNALRLTAQADSPFLPSSWLTSGLVAGARGEIGGAAYWLALLAANALFFAWLAAEIAQLVFHRGWSDLAGGGTGLRWRAPRGRSDTLPRLLAPLPAQARWLTVKDIRLFVRDPAQWSQFAIFFGMLLLYIANMRGSARGFSTALWQSWITMLNTVAALLVLATLTTRFVFPLLSLEGRRFWILGQAPIARRQLVLQKFWLSVAFSATITLGLALLSGWRLNLPLVPFAFSVFTVCSASVALSGLAVGLGCLYPNLAEDNPSRIVSGLGGTLTFILSTVYVVLVAGVETAVLHWSRSGHLLGGAGGHAWVIAGGGLLTLGVTAVMTLVPLRLGVRNLERLEV